MRPSSRAFDAAGSLGEKMETFGGRLGSFECDVGDEGCLAEPLVPDDVSDDGILLDVISISQGLIGKFIKF